MLETIRYEKILDVKDRLHQLIMCNARFSSNLAHGEIELECAVRSV